MKKLSTLFLCAVAMFMLASCGGASKKAEAEQSEKCCLPIGVQLYSVRDDMAKDFKGTLQKVKELNDAIYLQLLKTEHQIPWYMYRTRLY